MDDVPFFLLSYALASPSVSYIGTMSSCTVTVTVVDISIPLHRHQALSMRYRTDKMSKSINNMRHDLTPPQ
ncbi:hypothetical protein AFLA_003933 [Aspergillus flavus NRRL3357]|nr:hypothetical protein AFLA_003933 [Aspergillus flavus NRRL3357]